MRRRSVLVLGAAVIACALAAAVLLPRPQPAPKRSASPPAELVALGPHGSELSALLGKGKDTVFHARYRALSEDPAAAGQELTMELWRKAPRERFDVNVAVDGREVRSSVLRLPDRAMACMMKQDEPWSCQPVGANQPAGPDALIAQVAGEVKGGSIAARDDRVSDLDVRCFTLPLEAYPGEVCLTSTGIPVRVSAGPSQIELVTLVTTVPDEVFSPPDAAG